MAGLTQTANPAPVGPGDTQKTLHPKPRRSLTNTLAIYVLFSLFLYKDLLVDPNKGYLRDSGSDEDAWEWFFRVTADNVAHLHNPLFTDLQNFPDGVNLMANTSMLGLSVPLTPITLVLGAPVTFALVLSLGLAATGVAWDWFIGRWLVSNRWAAALGGAVCAFAPPVMSHANAHPNFCVLFMIPLIIDRSLRLCTPNAERRATGRDGALLGLFSAYQLFLGEEAFLLTALGLLLFVFFYAIFHPFHVRAALRPLLQGLGVAVAVCVPLVAFPLYWQFMGPQSYRSLLHGEAGNSPLSFVEFAQRSLFGNEATADRLAFNRTEQNAFFGWPLLVLGAAVAYWYWRRPSVKALTLTGVTGALLSLGNRIQLPGTDIVLSGPWRAMARIPLFETVLEGRVAMTSWVVMGFLVATGTEGILGSTSAVPAPRHAPPNPDEAAIEHGGNRLKAIGLMMIAAALLPIAPTPFPVSDRGPVPEFFTQGLWRKYVRKGETVVPIPLPAAGTSHMLHWQVSADLAFKLPGGYFAGPYGPDRTGIYGAPPRLTSNLLQNIHLGAQPPDISQQWQHQAREDLTFWKAGVLVLAPQDHEMELRNVVTALLGGQVPHWEGGAWIWDVGA